MQLCRAKGVEAIFHKWAEVSEVIPPSPMVGGHSGGEVKYSTAIVEFIHNGQISEVMANDVVFCDTAEMLKIISQSQKGLANKTKNCRICNDWDLIYDIVCYIPDDNGGATDISINYCPNCGKELNEGG